MPLFISSRQHFLNRFEPCDDGFVYRATPGSGGIRITGDEKQQIVGTYDRTVFPDPFVIVLGALAGLVLACASSFFVTSLSWRFAIFLAGYFGLPLVYAQLVDPMRKPPLRGRAESGVPPGTSDRRRRQLADTSWSCIATWIVLAAVQLQDSVARHRGDVSAQALWIALFAIPLAYSVYFAFDKLRRS